MRIDGVAWLVLVLVSYGVGSLLFSTRQLWHLLRGGDAGEALCDVALIAVPVIHLQLTGRDVLGIWGQLMLEPISLRGLELDIRADVARVHLRQGRQIPSDDELEIEALTFRGALARVLHECELHDLVSADKATKTYALTVAGKSAVRAARRLVRDRKLELGL